MTEGINADSRPDSEATLRAGSRTPQQSATILTLDEAKRRHVVAVLAQLEGNKARTARVLDVDRRTLYRWLEKRGVS